VNQLVFDVAAVSRGGRSSGIFDVKTAQLITNLFLVGLVFVMMVWPLWLLQLF
jgi:hypothetical protein